MEATVQGRRYLQSVEYYEKACDALAGGVNSSFRLGGQPVPLCFERAEGAWLYDIDGNAYVDYALGMGPCVLGHAPSAVTTAVAASLSKGQLFGGQHRQELQLAQRIQALVPCAELVRFGLSGSEMVQAALRLARASTERSKVVKFEGHYHGWFDTILVSVAPPVEEAGLAADPVPHLPSKGQSRSAAADVIVLPWNDLDAVRRRFAADGHEIAGVIMEPILCNTGVILPHPGYLEGVRELCDRYGAVLIFDEVITGFRVGLGGAQQRLGIAPDLTVFAKSLGAGFPIAALAGRRRIMNLVGAGTVLHGGTYNANTVSVAAALAAVEELSRDQGHVYAEMERHGQCLMTGLRAIGRRVGVPLLVQGLETVFNTAFTEQAVVTDYRSYQRCDAALQRRFLLELQHRGVRPTSRGTWFLSTVHSEKDVDLTLRAAEAALAAIA